MLYEYECASCGYICEFDQRITDKPKKKCPKCNKRTLKRLISRTSFKLVGPGWFKDGY